MRFNSQRGEPWPASLLRLMREVTGATGEARRATLASLLRKVADGIRLCEHIEGTDGTTIFGHACAMGLDEAAGRAVQVRALHGLDQGEEPGAPGQGAQRLVLDPSK
jgi:hypothetical protein